MTLYTTGQDKTRHEREYYAVDITSPCHVPSSTTEYEYVWLANAYLLSFVLFSSGILLRIRKRVSETIMPAPPSTPGAAATAAAPGRVGVGVGDIEVDVLTRLDTPGHDLFLRVDLSYFEAMDSKLTQSKQTQAKTEKDESSIRSLLLLARIQHSSVRWLVENMAGIQLLVTFVG